VFDSEESKLRQSQDKKLSFREPESSVIEYSDVKTGKHQNWKCSLHKRSLPPKQTYTSSRQESPLNLNKEPIAAPVLPLMFSSTKKSRRSTASPSKHSQHSYDDETECSKAKKPAFQQCHQVVRDLDL